ncbi:MAG: chemotaxis protein CheA, partial [Nocardioidaceae bacterium]|nr:chemotaxis protein CheA [Nocardioidaceae bacterium]
VVEVADDGRGICLDRVRRTAALRGVTGVDDLAAADVARLVLLPGFSTSDTVGQVSGRGVGLDAVRHTVEQAGGRVEIDTEPGRGCTVRLRLPAPEVHAR